MIAIEKNIAAVRQRIKLAQAKILPDGEVVTAQPENVGQSIDKNLPLLLAVSKKQPVSAINQAIDAGIGDFGENYLQEAEAKIAELQEKSLTWHYIGAIQSNKTRAIASLFDWVHSVDRLSIAQRLSQQRPLHLAPLNICLQINIDNETSKSGIAPDQLADMATAIVKLPGVNLRGLMAIPAQTTDIDAKRKSFAAMRKLFEQLRAQMAQEQSSDNQFDTLSMGMSADLELAVAEGATLLRVGTDIFGPRGS